MADTYYYDTDKVIGTEALNLWKEYDTFSSVNKLFILENYNVLL